ncbi:MAG: hypothetical protein WC797_04790, partial [Candidatus Paceibacterota bacterium]
MRKLKYPRARRSRIVDKFHGVSVADPYRWMEKDSQERVDWLNRQEKLTNSFLRPLADCRSKLYERFIEAGKVGGISMPRLYGKRRFFYKRDSGQEMWVYMVQDGSDGEPRILLDPNGWSENHTTALSGATPSFNGKLVAYEVSEAGNDKNSIRVINADTGEILPDVIPADLYPDLFCWNDDNTGFWYRRRLHEKVVAGEEKRNPRIFFHKVGTNHSEDRIWFTSLPIGKDGWPWVTISDLHRYLVVSVALPSSEKGRQDLFVFDTKNPQVGPAPVLRNFTGEFSVDFHNDWLVLRINFDGADRFKVVKCKISDITKWNIKWTEIIPEHPSDIISSIDVVGDELFVEYTRDVTSVVKVYDMDGRFVRDIDLPKGSIWSGLDWDPEVDEMFYSYGSVYSPNVIVQASRATKEEKIFYCAPGGLDPAKF